jgi:hypothetical protein
MKAKIKPMKEKTEKTQLGGSAISDSDLVLDRGEVTMCRRQKVYRKSELKTWDKSASGGNSVTRYDPASKILYVL